MQNPKDLFLQTLNDSTNQAQKLRRLLTVSSLLRLSIVFIAIGLFIFTEYTLQIKVYFVIALTIIFLFLLKRHLRLKNEKAFETAKLTIAQNELKALEGDLAPFDHGIEFIHPNHEFAVDIDLFGKNSIFQHINRTQLKDGKEALAKLLLSNDVQAVEKKQEAIRELANSYAWRRDFQAQASLTNQDKKHQDIAAWMQNYQSKFPTLLLPFTYVFSALSVLSLVGYFYDFIPAKFPLILFFIGLAITGIFFKKVTRLIALTSKAHALFSAYEKLIALIENQSFDSELIQNFTAPIKQFQGKNASIVIKQYAQLLTLLDQRNNVLVALFSNAFLLTELRLSIKLEKWITTYGKEVESWFNVLAKLDAYHSLSNYAFTHPSFSYPKIDKSSKILEVQGAFHPTMKEEKAIGNDIQLTEHDFLIITGANMAGKSTFLRTVCMQIVLGNVGLPTPGKKAKYHPIKLITSMRTIDSLDEDTSYFFAELKRLKYIKEKTQKDRYFIVLDEILKGTNSKDKADGSKRFLNELVKHQLTGIIATHDLSLCSLSDHLEVVHNYYLDAEIIDDNLHFDYTLKPGICQNMNASFLLEKMELVPKVK